MGAAAYSIDNLESQGIITAGKEFFMAKKSDKQPNGQDDQKPGITLVYEEDGEEVFNLEFPPRGPRGKGARFNDEDKEHHYRQYLEIGQAIWNEFWSDRDDLAGLNRGDLVIDPKTGKKKKDHKGKVIRDPGNEKLVEIMQEASERYERDTSEKAHVTANYELGRVWEMVQMASQEQWLRENGAKDWPYRFKHKLAELPNGPDKQAIIEEIERVRTDSGDTTAYNQLSKAVNRKQPAEMIDDLRNRNFDFIIQARGNDYLNYVDYVHEDAKEEMAEALKEAYEWVDQNMLKRIRRMAEDLGVEFD